MGQKIMSGKTRFIRFISPLLAITGLGFSGLTMAANCAKMPVSGEVYNLVNMGSGKYMDVAGISQNDGANIHQWSHTGKTNQQFTLTKLGTGYWSIRPVHSDKAVDLYKSSVDDGGTIKQWKYWGGQQQQWRLAVSSSGGIKIASAYTGKLISVADSKNGADVFQKADELSAYQVWHFNPVNVSCGSAFKHPGILSAEADFERIRGKVNEKAEPWFSAWTAMTKNGFSSLGRKPRPLEKLIRGGTRSNFGQIQGDIWASYQSVLRWKISGDKAYADQAVRFLNAWSSTLKGLAGDSTVALTGLYAYQLANVAEILRSYDGWSEADQKRFGDMLIKHFYPMNTGFLGNHNGTCISHYWANWDLANIASAMAIGIFTDREDIYRTGLDYLHEGMGNGALDHMLFYRHPGNMGQYQESGRDQGHTTLGMALFGAIAEMAWHQGDDIFTYNNYQLLAISEYIAKYNLREEVPYKPYNNCDNVNEKVISDLQRGHSRPGWALIYNHYENRLGIAAPWSKKMAEKLQPEANDGADQPGWGTLTNWLAPFPLGGAPRNLTSTIINGEVVLSWWGAAGAESYRLQRAESANGPYSLIATRGAEELLTYTDADVEDGKKYFYRVTALSPKGESKPSNRVTVVAGQQLLMHMAFENQQGTAKGVIGRALEMNGVAEDILEMDASLFSNLSDFTLAGWVNLDVGKQWQRLFDIGASPQRFMTLVPYNNDKQACFIITKLGTAKAKDHVRLDDRLCGGAPVIGKWMHLAITLSGQTAVLYLNGEEVARKENMTLTPAQLGVLDRAWIGRSQSELGHDPLLDGRVDDVRLYSGALTASEIKDLVSRTSP